jgi:hypothetical protein
MPGVQTGSTQSTCTGDATSRSMTAAKEVVPTADGLLVSGSLRSLWRFREMKYTKEPEEGDFELHLGHEF